MAPVNGPAAVQAALVRANVSILPSVRNSKIEELAEVWLQLVPANTLAPDSLEQYTYSWRHFERWCAEHAQCPLPAEPKTVALYLTSELQRAVTGGHKDGMVKNKAVAVQFFHKTAGLNDPTKHPMVDSTLAAAKRTLAQASSKKQPLPLASLRAICARFALPGSHIIDLQVAATLAFAYAGFFRYSDWSAVRIGDIRFESDHLSVHLPKRKNDQFRTGNDIIMARLPGDPSCPVRLTEWLFARTLLPASAYAFSRLDPRGHPTGALMPYKEAMALFHDKFQAVGLDPKHYATHSARSGGASQAAASGVSDRLREEHGGWRSSKAAHAYVHTGLQEKLSVTRAMFSGAPLELPLRLLSDRPPEPPPGHGPDRTPAARLAPLARRSQEAPAPVAPPPVRLSSRGRPLQPSHKSVAALIAPPASPTAARRGRRQRWAPYLHR
jgi:hypothetical protein